MKTSTKLKEVFDKFRPHTNGHETAINLFLEAVKEVEKMEDKLSAGYFVNILPTQGLHKTLGKIEILGVRVKSTYSNNLMYMTIINGEMLWVYDYETELLFDSN